MNKYNPSFQTQYRQGSW